MARKKQKRTDFKVLGILPEDTPEAEVVQNIEAKVDYYHGASRDHRRQWLMNGAFARGQQFCVLHETDDRIIPIQQTNGRKMVTDDMISPWKEHMIANLTSVTPSFECVPYSTDSEAITAARLGSALLRHYWEDWRFLIDYIVGCGYLIDFANFFVYLNYEENMLEVQSQPKTDPETGEALMDEDGEPMYERGTVGDVTATVLPPQYVGCPLDSTPLDEKPWLFIRQWRPLDYFEATYGEEGKLVEEEEVTAKDSYHLDFISRHRNIGNTSQQIKGAHEVIYLQKPSALNPSGMVAVVANGKLLKNDPWPYTKLMAFPVEHFHSMKASGEFFARSSIEEQIPLQKALNLLVSIILENADDTAHPKVLIPQQAGVRSFSNVVENVVYNHPFAPTYLNPPAMPAYVQTMIQELKSAIRDKQNYHGASLGTSVSGVRSDAHAQNLQDQDLLPLTIIDNLITASYERLGEKILLIAADKLVDERIITYTGKNKRMMVESFRGSMLGDTRRVKVKMGNTWARSKAAVTSNILQMAQMGMIVDQFGQIDKTKVMKLMEFALPDGIFDDFRTHDEAARDNIDRVLNGQPPLPLLPWQNPKIHLDVYSEYLNSPEFTVLYEDSANNATQINALVGMYQAAANAYMQSLMALAPPPNEGGTQNEQAGQRPKQVERSE